MKPAAVVALATLAAVAVALAPSSLAAIEQVASAHAIGPGKVYDLSFSLGRHVLTVKSCDLTTRAGGTFVGNYTTLRSSQISVPHPLGGTQAIGVHLETNATALAFSGDFVLVNGQFTAVDGTGVDHTAHDQALVAVPLPVALVPAGLPFC